MSTSSATSATSSCPQSAFRASYDIPRWAFFGRSFGRSLALLYLTSPTKLPPYGTTESLDIHTDVRRNPFLAPSLPHLLPLCDSSMFLDLLRFTSVAANSSLNSSADASSFSRVSLSGSASFRFRTLPRCQKRVARESLNCEPETSTLSVFAIPPSSLSKGLPRENASIVSSAVLSCQPLEKVLQLVL